MTLGLAGILEFEGPGDRYLTQAWKVQHERHWLQEDLVRGSTFPWKRGQRY